MTKENENQEDAKEAIAMAAVAKTVSTMFKSLRAEGLSRREATMIVTEFISRAIEAAKEQGPEDSDELDPPIFGGL